jgi:hypothetical protein
MRLEKKNNLPETWGVSFCVGSICFPVFVDFQLCDNVQDFLFLDHVVVALHLHKFQFAVLGFIGMHQVAISRRAYPIRKNF